MNTLLHCVMTDMIVSQYVAANGPLTKLHHITDKNYQQPLRKYGRR